MNSKSKSAALLAHLRIPVSNLSATVKFFESIGGKEDIKRERFAVVELFDGTRIQLTEVSETALKDNHLQFDFKVADITIAWKEYSSKGLQPSKITHNRPGHDYFFLRGPDGQEIKINSPFNRG
tara:strand:- start:895 stop:1266 length:372 start_codon:yes stop_codon:yes gene_type:complete